MSKSNNKERTGWKTVTDKRGKYFTAEANPSTKINKCYKQY